FAPVAVPPTVIALVDVPVVVHLLDELAATLMVPRAAGLDERVVADVERLPDLLELAGHVVTVVLRLLAEFRGAVRHFYRIFVVAHQEEDAVSLHAAVASLYVGADLLKRGADVRAAVRVVDGGGQKKLRRGVGHGRPSVQRSRNRDILSGSEAPSRRGGQRANVRPHTGGVGGD